MAMGIKFVIILVLLRLFIAKEHDNNSTENKVLNIGGLFAIHGKSKNRTSPCGPFRLGGFEELNAMLFAVSKINEDERLLPGIQLQADTVDSCSSVERATEKSLNYTIINYQSIYECFGNHSTHDKPVIAIVGERSSDVSRAVTNLVGIFHIPVISYGATSPSLSGMKYFIRTVPPDTFVTQALVDVLQRFGWNYVILLYSDDEYGRFAADSFRECLRKEMKHICTAVDEPINRAERTEDMTTWEKMHQEKHKTKVVVVFATYEDFSGFLQTGKAKYELEEYIWLSNDMWNGQMANLTGMLGHAISVIPHQDYIEEFEQFFYDNHKEHNHTSNLKKHSTFNENWFETYDSLAATKEKPAENMSKCLHWGSSEVSFVMDAVYTIAWALHNILNCDNASTGCNKSEGIHFFQRELLDAIMSVNFQNDWTKNKISFTRKGNPRNIKYYIVSLQQKEQCFAKIGHWDCLVDNNETCKGNLSLEDTSGIQNCFLGVCGALCPAGQYKIVDKHFASCCWQCRNCTRNKYSTKPGSSACKTCNHDEWPTGNHTACVKVTPKTIFFTGSTAGIILLCVNILCIKVLIAFVILIIKHSQSRMKIFRNRILCYILLSGILVSNISSILVLADIHRNNCLLTVVLSKLGTTCTLATIFVKTNDVYRTYKKKILKGDPRFLSQGFKVMVIICLVIVDMALLSFSINFKDTDLKRSTTVYFPTETINTAYVHCTFILEFVSRDIFSILETTFYWGLLIICTQQAYLTRKVTDHAHGLRYVFFGFLALSVSGATLMLGQSFTNNKGITKELIYSFYHLFFATVALACMFIPKVDILVFHPEKDVLFDALRATAELNHEEPMISMSKRDKSIAEMPGTSHEKF